MCGIAGYIGHGSADVLAAMSAAIAHRGPDDQGIFTAEGVGLAHRRLSIIDLSPAGHQPMISPEGDVLVFNGEIYNFREIRVGLEKLGHRFSSQSDSEVILHAYRQWGEACVQHFRGMFAFAIWDARQRKLFAARDRVGIKPFYYLEQNGVFYFASEAKALLEVPAYQRRLNRHILPLYLTFRYTPGEETLFFGIKKLLPGHFLTISPGGRPQIARFWQLNFEPDDRPSEKQWQELFWGTFEEAVRLRMISDVPLGAYLSGGLDSSLIVAAMSDISGRPIDAFSVGFRDERFSELGYAREVADRFGCRHHVLHAEEDAAQVLSEVVWHLDEPLGDLATIPTYLMARATKPHATVVLSGEGADELMAGYPKYRAFLLGRRLAPFLPGGAWAVAGRLSCNISLQRAFHSQARPDRPAAYLDLTSVFDSEEKGSLMIPEIRREIMSEAEVEGFIRPFFRPDLDGLSQLLALDFHTWLPDDLLLKNDKMTMAHAVEARVPYLDHKLVELCARIPSRFKLRWNQEKVLLRKVMAGRLPERIRRRKKAGFTVPLHDWNKGPFALRVNEIFSDTFVARQRLFNPDYLQTLQKRSLSEAFYRRQFWTMAALGLWQKKFGVEV